jgi:hypothetical protein
LNEVSQLDPNLLLLNQQQEKTEVESSFSIVLLSISRSQW